MRYFANPSSPAARDAMTTGLIGCIVTPAEGKQPPPDAIWCADNGCFGKGYPGDHTWLRWLTSLVARHGTTRCAFAVAPDVVGDATATLTRSAPWLPAIRGLGIPAALVAQDGLQDLTVPWEAFDVLFIGGTTDWKLSGHAASLAGQAKARGKAVHLGRVNSYRRLEYARAIGCDTADGTFLAFGPDTNLPRLIEWLRRIDADQPLYPAGQA